MCDRFKRSAQNTLLVCDNCFRFPSNHHQHHKCHDTEYLGLPVLDINLVKWVADSCMTLKELEHRKMGWKVFILKYDLGKSVSKEMWCKMSDTKTKLTSYFKRRKMHVIWVKSFLCPWTRKWFPLIMNGILEMSWFVLMFLQN